MMHSLKTLLVSASLMLMGIVFVTPTAFAALSAFTALSIEGNTPERLKAGVYDARQLPEAVENKAVMLVDVRTADEYKSGHINGAVSLPLGEPLKKNLDTLPTDKTVVFYCFRGKRSEEAYNIALQTRPELAQNVYYLDARVIYTIDGDVVIQINS